MLNTSSDFIDILTEILELEGFNTIAEFTSVFRKGEKDIHTFFAEHQPDVVIYDIAIPYEINWHFFQSVVETSGFKPCQFIVVTTNKSVFDHLVGKTGSLQIVGKPTDLDTLITAVRTALDQC